MRKGVDAGDDRFVSSEGVFQLGVELVAFNWVNLKGVSVRKRDNASGNFIIVKSVAGGSSQIDDCFSLLALIDS